MDKLRPGLEEGARVRPAPWGAPLARVRAASTASPRPGRPGHRRCRRMGSGGRSHTQLGGPLRPGGPTGAATSGVRERGHSDFLPRSFTWRTRPICRGDHPEAPAWVRGVDHLLQLHNFPASPRTLPPPPPPLPVSGLALEGPRGSGTLQYPSLCAWPFTERDVRQLSRAVAGVVAGVRQSVLSVAE